MLGVYTASIQIASLSTAKTVMLATGPATKVIEILQASLTNMNVNTSEQLRVGIYKITTLGSPVGSAVNVKKHESGSPATSVTWLGDLTVEPTLYDTQPLNEQGVNNLGGYYCDSIPESRFYLSPSESLGFRLLSAPTNSFICSAVITYREIG